MPHCILEITQNLSEGIDPNKLMIEVSKAINSDNLFESNDIKTRIYIVEHSLMGEKEQPHSYVSAEIVMLDNKTESQNQSILNAVQNVLISYFKASEGKFSITSRLTHVNPGFYKRHVNY